MLIQDVRLSTALAKSLSVAGRIDALTLSDGVVPVVIAGDVTEDVANAPVNFAHMRSVTAVAAQYARVAFEVQANTTLREVALKRLRIVSNTAQQLWLGYSGALVGATVDGAPQRTRYSQRNAPSSARLIGDTSAVVPALAGHSLIVNVLGSAEVVVDFGERPPLIDVFTQGALYVIQSTVQNATLLVSAEWVEVPKVL